MERVKKNEKEKNKRGGILDSKAMKERGCCLVS